MRAGGHWDCVFTYELCVGSERYKLMLYGVWEPGLDAAWGVRAKNGYLVVSES